MRRSKNQFSITPDFGRGGRLSWEPIFHSWSSIPSQAAVTQSFCSYLIICCILSFAAVDPDFQKLRLPTGQVFVFNVYIGTRHHWGFSLQSWHEYKRKRDENRKYCSRAQQGSWSQTLIWGTNKDQSRRK